MDKKHLLNFAMMKVNDSHSKDYYDNFVPFVKEALRVTGIETISVNDLKSKIKSLFDLDLPINVVNTILRRRLKPKGYVKIVNQTFQPNYDKLEDSSFTEVKHKMLEKHEKLISDLVTYCKSQFNKQIEKEEMEVYFESFIEKHQLSLLERSINKTPFSDENKLQEEMDIIISSYIKACEKEYSVNFQYLIEIVKGAMLVNALYYNDLNNLDMKFKGTEVFFDSSFIIYALGLAGAARQEPCIELIDMLRKSNAILRIFRHNIEEIIGILEWCKNNYTKTTSDHHGTINHFLSMGYSVSDIERIIYALENEIEGTLNIKIVESVSFDRHEYVIAEQDLENFLSDKLKYLRKNALERDVTSVSAIARLRRGKKSLHLESCRAVFVTTNASFASNVKDFFLNEEMPRIIPPVLHDSTITNLVWLKNPSKAPDLPTKRLIAECYAATSPKEHLWSRYIETVKIFEKTNKISQEDIVLLRYTPGARDLLVEKTLGDEDTITIGTVQEILEEIKITQLNQLQTLEKQKDLELNLLKEQIEQTKQETAAADELRLNNIKLISRRRSKIITNIFSISFSIIFGLLIFYLPILVKLEVNLLIKLILIFLISILPSVLGLFNINILPIVNYFNKRLEERIFNSLMKRYN